MDTDDTLIDTGDPAPEPSRADDIASAFDEIESRDASPAPDGAPANPAPAGSPGERARGTDGKFLPGTPATAAPKAPAAPGKPPDTLAGKPPAAPGQRVPDKPQGPADPAAAATPQLRPPAAWKPQEREHWAKLPPDVQQAVIRREQEVGRTLQESAKARDALSHVQGVIGPYAQNIAASGSDAIGAIQNFFQADNTLRHGSIVEKAQLAANIIKQYGIDISTLDSLLAGQQPRVDPNQQVAEQLRREMQQQLQPVMQYFGQMQGQRQQAVARINQDAAGQVEQFSQDGAHEFFDDVREDMADLIDMYTARGQQISLQDAYDRAIMMNPQVSQIMTQRAESQRVTQAAQAAQRARRAAVSISGSSAPAGTPGAAGASRHADIEAAWDDASGS